MMNLLFASECYAIVEYPSLGSVDNKGRLEMTPYCFELVDRLHRRSMNIVGIPALQFKNRLLKYIQDESPTVEQMGDFIDNSMGGSIYEARVH